MHFIRTPPIRQPGQRAVALSIALALQITFLLLLIQAIEKARPALRSSFSRELTLILPRPAPARPASRPRASGIPAIIRPNVTPPMIIAPAPQAAPLIPPSSLKGFGQALNDCAPQNYDNLPGEKKALCARPGEGVAVQQAQNLMGAPSAVKDEAHWQAELARKQSPALLPCNGFLNVACLLAKIADGSLTDYGDPRTWPNYAIKQLQPEDFYTIEQSYNEWHAAHGKAH